MQLVSLPPGSAFDRSSIAEPRSLSEISTVPAAKRLPETAVALVNAPKVADPAAMPTRPTRVREARSLRREKRSGIGRPAPEVEADRDDAALVAAAQRLGEPGAEVERRSRARVDRHGGASAQITERAVEDARPARGDLHPERVVEVAALGQSPHEHGQPLPGLIRDREVTVAL